MWNHQYFRIGAFTLALVVLVVVAVVPGDLNLLAKIGAGVVAAICFWLAIRS